MGFSSGWIEGAFPSKTWSLFASHCPALAMPSRRFGLQLKDLQLSDIVLSQRRTANPQAGLVGASRHRCQCLHGNIGNPQRSSCIPHAASSSK